jgi:uncharacterized membrane protein
LLAPYLHSCIKLKGMNLKRIFGTILTVFGIIGLIYAAVGFIQNSEGYKSLIVFAVLGLIFFITGIGLVRSTTDQSK